MMTKQISKDENISGWINGFIGVVLFSGGLPATKLAVMEMSPTFVTIVRAAVAGVLALTVLWLGKEKRPVKKDLIPLLLVSLGCVVGFPLLSALALQYLTSAHSIVFLGMLPLATAVFGVMRGGERPHPVFWFFSIVGSLLVIGYAVSQGISASPVGDILMLLAVILCGMGYAEGAKLSKTLGGWQVISWALVLALPIMIPLFFIYFPDDIQNVSFQGWFGMAYISLFSMFIGFIFWYKGLAQGGIATVGQLQLLQPFFGLALAAWLLHEQVSIGMLGVTVGVILCVAGTKKFAK
ncbi:drug/metabolite transporter (DMT)-like permease [Chryseobacterium bernardetii]|uniref:Drug/metabolite transporter (DMT)-like permease n=2 Tax=Chryseobacterium TaxID=59732 RepID=A0A543EIW7_9FLAO|nr:MULTISPECIES: DMT family transporter [Chryseobacterium]MDR6369953.1 drug/metabolite transporter (DMT)-like permease [Chryseobacterium vietnamense]MDR6440804.1 drug/metabolite transporter (DMT)-like permease [Chryseobacterium bernardetii]MDR6486692.1 drug/metabolite transporter (DMT)-like permease [Chryseobacterium vietnamense]TQM21517.1 drug/metabolite transporter (DMT)-like permease [Chryseobacterium aquifrigidense]